MRAEPVVAREGQDPSNPSRHASRVPARPPQGQGEPLQNFARTATPPCVASYRTRQWLSEDLPAAAAANTEEPPRLEHDPHSQTFPWQVLQLPPIAAVDSKRCRPTRRARRGGTTCHQLHLDHPILRAQADQFHFRVVRDRRSLSHRPERKSPELPPSYASQHPDGKNHQMSARTIRNVVALQSQSVATLLVTCMPFSNR